MHRKRLVIDRSNPFQMLQLVCFHWGIVGPYLHWCSRGAPLEKLQKDVQKTDCQKSPPADVTLVISIKANNTLRRFRVVCQNNPVTQLFLIT